MKGLVTLGVGLDTSPNETFEDLPSCSSVIAQAQLTASAGMSRRPRKNKVICAPGLVCAYGLRAWGAEVLLISFTGEIEACGREGRTVVIVYLVTCIGVCFVAQGRGVGHGHVGTDEAGELEEEKHDDRVDRQRIHRIPHT